ncbi:hypothetical protein WG66_013173 [Moniliophthora roreri]|nr:hypothetical protein WG66_013173 [Moniliophthora roreri]
MTFIFKTTQKRVSGSSEKHTPGSQDAEDAMVMEMKQSERIMRRKWGIGGGMLHAILPPIFVFLRRKSGSNLATAMSADLFLSRSMTEMKMPTCTTSPGS